MRRSGLATLMLVIIAILALIPTISISAVGDQYRRWLDNGKTYTCTDMGSYITVGLSNQDVEFHSLPTTAQFTLNYIDNGVNTPNGPFAVEQTSGTHAYGAFAENISAPYPVTFEFRIDTIIGGVTVYQSSLVVNCSSDTIAPVPVSPVNTDTGPGGDQYRRWLDDGKTFTCTDMGDHIQVTLSNQDVEFSNLPADAEFTLNYIDNGVNTPSGPYVVEQTSGTRAYGAFAESIFTPYPVTFEFRMDTIINGVVVYQSSLVVNCSADSSGSPTIVNVPYSTGGSSGGATGGCATPLPDGSVQGRVAATVNALYEPRADATTNVVLPAGSSWWVIGAQGGFYKLWIACNAAPVWVSAGALSPNYDPPWNGAPLPDAGA